MDMRTFLHQTTQEEREALADKVESSVAYFYQIAGGHKRPGPKLCRKLVASDPRLTLNELRPDIWGADAGTRRRASLARRSTDKGPG